MLLRAPKKKTKAKAKRYASTPKKSGMAFWLILAGVFIALSAFISLEASILATGFICICAILFYDMRRRKLWESAFSFRLKSINSKYERITRDITRHTIEIKDLKNKQAQTLHRQNDMPASKQKKQRPTLTPRPSYINHANDDPYFEQNALSDTVVTELIHHAVRSSRIEVFAQPIIRLPQRKTRYYEMFARIRASAGSYLPAVQYMRLAQKESLVNNIDTLLLIECLKTIQKTAHLDNAIPFILNIGSETLKNKSFMGKLLNFLAKNRKLAPRLIFEIKQSDFDNMHPAILEILRGLGTLGCALSIDNVETLEFDIKFLQVLKVRLVKIRSAILLEKIKTPQGTMKARKIKRLLEGNGIAVVVERIENEKELRALLDLDIKNAQGYLFGKPEPQGIYQKKKAA